MIGTCGRPSFSALLTLIFAHALHCHAQPLVGASLLPVGCKRETCVLSCFKSSDLRIYLPKLNASKTMSRKYKIRDQNALYFVTFTVIHWLDVFIRREYKDIFLESIRYCQKNKGLEVIAYCIMSSHIHMIIGRHGDPNMEHIIRDIKKYTSSKLIEAIRDNPQESRKELFLWLFESAGKSNSNNTNYHADSYRHWQQNNQPIELTSDELIYQKLDYIHNNPVEAGIVLSLKEYLYSSAINYAGRPEKLIDVILI
jgi:putative transposase